MCKKEPPWTEKRGKNEWTLRGDGWKLWWHLPAVKKVLRCVFMCAAYFMLTQLRSARILICSGHTFKNGGQTFTVRRDYGPVCATSVFIPSKCKISLSVSHFPWYLSLRNRERVCNRAASVVGRCPWLRSLSIIGRWNAVVDAKIIHISGLSDAKKCTKKMVRVIWCWKPDFPVCSGPYVT